MYGQGSPPITGLKAHVRNPGSRSVCGLEKNFQTRGRMRRIELIRAGDTVRAAASLEGQAPLWGLEPISFIAARQRKPLLEGWH